MKFTRRSTALFCMLISGVFFGGAIAPAGAQESSHTVSGVVRDAKTGEPIVGVTVLLKDTYKGALTDGQGNYTLADVPTGTQTLTFSHLSYQATEVAVVIGQGAVTGLDVQMDEQTVALNVERVTVKGRLRSDTENYLIGTIKRAAQVTSGVSAAQISKSADRNASEVVRRVPGITVIDDRFIIVRGLSQRYNNAWLNGLAVPSTESDSRAFSFELIPSSQIENLLIYKSASADIPGDFSGGFVRINTKSIPDRNATELGYTTGFYVKTQFQDFRSNPAGPTDFLGFDLSKRPLGKDFPDHLQNVTDPARITELTQSGLNTDWSIKSRTPLPDQRLSLSLARRFETAGGKTVGNITALNYSNTRKTIRDIWNVRYGIYSSEEDRPVFLNRYTDDQYTEETRVGLMHNWAFLPGENNRIEFKNLFNLLGKNRLTYRAGTSENSGIYYQQQTEMLYSSRLAYTGQLAGTHDFQPHGTLTWNAGYSYANNHEPDRRIAFYQTGMGNALDTPPGDVGNDNIKRYFQSLHDHVASAAANYRQTLGEGKFQPVFKGGLYGEYHTRNYTPREFIYRYSNLSYQERQTYLLLPVEQMMQPRYLGADKVYLDEITRKTDAYSADVIHGAAYGMLEFSLGQLDVYAGVRLESHTARLTYDRTNLSDRTMMTTRTTADLNLLPSVNLTYKFSDRHQLRAAYGRSVNRPELRELSPMVYFDFDLFSEIGGNPELKTARIDNFDLRYEFYPGSGETISIGAFYKRFKNPIEWTFIDMGGSLRYQYQNARKAVSWGVELDVRKELVRNLFVVLNAAWIESNVTFWPGEVVSEPERPMQGQSPYIINAGLYYNSEPIGLGMSVLYNRIGKRVVGLGKQNSIEPDPNSLIPDSYEMPRNSLDFTISQRLSKRVTLRASVRDILGEPVVYKQFPSFVKAGVLYQREQVTRKYTPGQSVSLGVSVKI